MCFKMKKSLWVLMISCLFLWGSLQGSRVQAQGNGAEGESEASVTFYYGDKQPPKPKPIPDKPSKPDLGKATKPGILPQTGESKSYASIIGLLCISLALICLITSKKNRRGIYK